MAYYIGRVDSYERDLLFLLNDLGRLLRTEFDKRARSHGMTRAQWVILVWLDRRPGLSQKELAELLEVEPISVARLVDRLERRGMVERRPDERDRRIWRLHLRQAGARLLADVERCRRELRGVLLEGLDRPAVTTITEGMLRMKANVSAARRNESRETA